MTTFRSRLLKKIHQRCLQDVMCDLSLDSFWRTRLFEAAPGQVFTISAEDTRGLCKATVAAIRRYKLHYSVQTVESAEGACWWGADDVIFKFWATDFPTLRSYSANNPAVI